jgi:hypothetical protein
MNCIAFELENDDISKAYIKETQDKFNTTPENLITFPLKGVLKGFNRDHLDSKGNIIKQTTLVMCIKILAFPVYWLSVIFTLLWAFWTNLFTGILMSASLILIVPFTSTFWYLMFKIGLKKKGFKGKIKRITLEKAWGRYVGTD